MYACMCWLSLSLYSYSFHFSHTECWLATLTVLLTAHTRFGRKLEPVTQHRTHVSNNKAQHEALKANIEKSTLRAACAIWWGARILISDSKQRLAFTFVHANWHACVCMCMWMCSDFHGHAIGLFELPFWFVVALRNFWSGFSVRL